MTITIDTTTAASIATSNPVMDAVSSMAHELLALVIFFITWAAVNYYMKVQPVYNSEKNKATIDFNKRKQSPQEITEVMQNLCSLQFTRGLRLYRQLVKTDQDKEIVDEAFYTALVEASIRVGKADVAEQVCQRMHENKMVPSAQFLASLLKLFAARKNFHECVNVWKLFEIPADQVIYSCLTLAASELGDVDLSRTFLQLSAKHFAVSSRDYIPLMRLHARRKDATSAVAELRGLMTRGLEIENIVFNTVLAVCINSADTKVMYGLVEEMQEYQKKFEKPVVDTVSYNTMMKALARQRDVPGCFELLEKICQSKVQPDDVTYSTLLDVCIDEDEHQLASEALDKMCASGVQMNCVLLTTLMKGFIRSRHLDMAMNLFESMQANNSQVKPDMITYSMIIKAQCDAGDMGRALQVLEDMLQNSCDVDDVVFTHLIEGCCHVSNVALAEKLYRDMRLANINPSIYTLTAMVKVYGKCQQSDKAWELVRTMEEEFGLKPSVVIVTCLISGLLRQKKYQDAYDAYKWMFESNTVQPDAQSVRTMIMGLADAQMWKELVDITTAALNPARRPPLRLPNECMNYALTQMLARGSITWGRKYFALLAERSVEVTVPSVKRRLNLQ